MVYVIQYVIQMRDHLEEMTSLARGTLKRPISLSKPGMIRAPGKGSFMPGQKVLLLLPTNGSKLLVRWHRPYKVL